MAFATNCCATIGVGEGIVHPEDSELQIIPPEFLAYVGFAKVIFFYSNA